MRKWIKHHDAKVQRLLGSVSGWADCARARIGDPRLCSSPPPFNPRQKDRRTTTAAKRRVSATYRGSPEKARHGPPPLCLLFLRKDLGALSLIQFHLFPSNRLSWKLLGRRGRACLWTRGEECSGRKYQESFRDWKSCIAATLLLRHNVFFFCLFHLRCAHIRKMSVDLIGHEEGAISVSKFIPSEGF